MSNRKARVAAQKVRDRLKREHDRKRDQPDRRDVGIVSAYNPENGEVVVAVRRGLFAAAQDILYKIQPEVLAGACGDRKQLATIINNVGLMVVSQLCGFNLAESLDEMPKSIAKWGHIDLAALRQDDKDDAEREAAALRTAQLAMHRGHGSGAVYAGPSTEDCSCRTSSAQTICAEAGCGFCKAQGFHDQLSPVLEMDPTERQLTTLGAS